MILILILIFIFFFIFILLIIILTINIILSLIIIIKNYHFIIKTISDEPVKKEDTVPSLGSIIKTESEELHQPNHSSEDSLFYSFQAEYKPLLEKSDQKLQINPKYQNSSQTQLFSGKLSQNSF